VLRIMHQVGADAPVVAYMEHHGWPEAIRAARDAHVRLATNDQEDPNEPPRSLDVLAVMLHAV
jgi:ABC-type sugar transport system substrate-binding protein